MSQPTTRPAPSPPSRLNPRLNAALRAAAATSLTETSLPPLPPSTTVRRLRRAQVLVVAAVLILGVVSAWQLIDLRSQLAGASQLAAQSQRLAQVEADVIEAGNLARSAALGRSDVSATAAINDASSALVAAAADRPADRSALADLGAATARYGATLATGAGGLSAADTTLDKELLPALEELRSQLANTATQQPWNPGGLVLWAAVVLAMAAVVVASIDLARLSHRFVNVGVALSAVAVVMIGVIGSAGLAQAAAADQSARVDAFTNVATLGDARVSLAELRRAQLTAALAKSVTPGELSNQKKSLAALRSPAQLPTTVTAAVTKQYEAVSANLSAGDWAGARRTLIADTTAKNDTAVIAVIDKAGLRLITAATSRSGDTALIIAGEAATVGLLALFGAVLGYWGVANRLKEYR